MVSNAFVLTVSVYVFPLPSYSYSSGAVYVWNMADGGGPVCVSCSTQRDQFEPPTPTNCAIHQSGWGVIGNCNGRLHCKIGIETVHQKFNSRDNVVPGLLLVLSSALFLCAW